jgi:hypothetical protein
MSTYGGVSNPQGTPKCSMCNLVLIASDARVVASVRAKAGGDVSACRNQELSSGRYQSNRGKASIIGEMRQWGGPDKGAEK